MLKKATGLIALFVFLVCPSKAQQIVRVVSGVATLDVERYSKFKVIVDQNVTSVVISPSVGVPTLTAINVLFVENSVGGFSVTFGGNTSGSCTITTTANAGTTCTLQFDGASDTWFITGGASSGGGDPITTVAGLASVSGKTKGTIAVVTDGSSGTDCTVGGGTSVVACQYSGTVWAQLTAASAGATAFSAITGGTNAAALVMGTGGSLATSGAGTIAATSAPFSGLIGSASCAQLPALTGDTTTSAGSCATTVGKINGTSLAALATGILKNTTTTGVPSIAVAGDFPTLNQNTTGSAASFTGSLAGDVTGTQSATVVGKINGTSLAGLATGILKNTTATGVPSIAVAGDFPTLNQNTTGTSAGLSLPSGTATMGTAAIASGACATVVTATAAGITTATGSFSTNFSTDPTAITGYGVSATGAVLTIYPFITTGGGSISFKVCNNTNASITPAALTLNWQVTHL